MAASRHPAIARLRDRLREAEDTIAAIRSGAVDAIVVSGPDGDRVFTLEGAERPYRVFVEEMPEPAVILTREGLVRYSNRRLAELLNLPLQSVIGQSLRRFLDSGFRDALATSLRDAGGTRARIHGVLTTSDGLRLHVRFAIRALPGSEDLVSAVLTDVTEERRLERARVLIDELSGSIDDSGTLDIALQQFAEKVCAATGWPVAELWTVSDDQMSLVLRAIWNETWPVSKRYLVASGATSTRKGAGFAGRAWESGQPIVVDGADLAAGTETDLSGFTAAAALALPVTDGTHVVAVVVFYAARVRDDEDQLRQLATSAAAQVSLLIQRNEAKQLLVAQAEELRRSNAELEQFAYIVSHDLQEPLRTVVRYVQLLEKRCKPALDEHAREYIDFVVSGSRRMSELLTGVLDYSRATRELQPAREVAIDGIVESVLRHLSVTTERAGARVTCDPLPTVRGDPNQLMQVFQNLVANAMKFRSDAPPDIRISARRGDREWVFTVADNGIGVPAEGRARIFEIFQRLHTPGQFPGTGIGLAVCKRVVEHHHGRIWVESDGVSGSAFSFSLPDDPAAARRPTPVAVETV